MQSTVGVGFLYWGAMGEPTLTRRVVKLQTRSERPTVGCVKRLLWLVVLASMSACRDHLLDDGPYAFSVTEVLRDDCGLATSGTAVVSGGTLRSEGNLVQFSLTQPELRLVGTYLSSVEQMTLDGSISNYSAVLRGRECLLDTVSFHLDTTTLSDTRFEGAMSISYEARQPDECVCRYWFKLAGQKQ